MQKYENDSGEGWRGIDSIPYGTGRAQYCVVNKHACLKKNIKLPLNGLTQDEVQFDTI